MDFSAKIVIKGRENSNLFKLLERETEHVTLKIGPLYFIFAIVKKTNFLFGTFSSFQVVFISTTVFDTNVHAIPF